MLVFIFSIALLAEDGVSEKGIVSEVPEKVDEYLESATELDRYSGSVLIARGEETMVKQGYGMSDREHGVANSLENKYRLGSMTKQFTAMGILQLYEKGKLKLTDPVTQYMPRY